MKKIIGLILMLSIAVNVLAQVPVIKNTKIYKFEGRNYYLHTVKQGQTLYSISKAYNANQRDVMYANDMQSVSLKVGQKLKIPVVNPINAAAEEEPLFYHHRIKPGETLYAIAKIYDSSVENILAFNPQSIYGISPGQILTIPNPRQGHADQQDKNFYYHTVATGETLFLLAQQYGITINQIYLFNPETKSGLTAGDVLKIPKTSYDITEKLPVSKYSNDYMKTGANDPNYFTDPQNEPCFNYTYNPSKRFKVALMLPLFIDKNMWKLKNYDEDQKKSKFYRSSEKFLQFYEGAMLAVNQIKYDGVSVELHVFDTKNDAAEVRKILNKLNLKEFDLIIGPVYSKNFKIVAEKAKRNRVNIVSPLSANPQNLVNNPYVFQVNPSNTTRVKKTSELISKFYDSTIVIIHNGSPKDMQNISLYKRKLVKAFTMRPDVQNIALKTVNYNFGGKSNIEDAFSVGNKNIVIIPDDKEAFVTGVIEQLFLFAEKYDITLIGSPNWELFQNINIRYLKRMNFNYASPFYIDYSHWKVKQFVKKFRTAYKTEPNIYAFQGYDVIYYFLDTLKKYGKLFQFCIENNLKSKKGIIFDFDFHRTDTYNGFENKGIHYLTYGNNYKLTETKIR